MNYPLLFVYATSIFLLIATPGPVVGLLMNTASRYGFRTAFLTVLGAHWASLLLLSASALVISGLISVSVLALQWISLLGCVFIAWVAMRSLQEDFSRLGDAPAGAPLQAHARSRSPVLNGFLTGISNPKEIIFFVAFFPQFINITASFEVSLVILTIVWIIFDLVIMISYIAVMKSGFFQQRRKAISVLSASFLLLVATVGFCYAVLEIMA